MKFLRSFLAAAVGAALFSCGDGMHPTSPDGRSGLRVKADAISSEGAGGPSVSTDQTDYYPGDTVIITGTAWQPNESIALRLEETPAVHEPLQWSVTADSIGGFTDRTFVVQEHDLGTSFTLYATGATSADTAQFSFTDANLVAKTNVEQVTGVTWTKYSAATNCSGASPGTGGPSTVTTSALTLYSSIPSTGSVKVDSWSHASGLKFINWTNAAVILTDSLACLNNNGTWTLNLGYLTQTAISASPPSPSSLGDLVTFTATVTKTFDASAVSTNKVKFYDGGTDCTTGLGTQIIGPSGVNGENLSPTGTATLATSSLTAGVHTIWACYPEGSGPAGAYFFASGNSMSFTVNGLGPTKLVITTADINGVVGQCYGPITVQSQNAAGTPTNATSNITVNLSTDDAGTLYSDACTTVATSVTILSGSNSTTFYYKPTAVGNSPHTLTAADNAGVLTSDTQDETVSKASTSATIGSNNNPSEFGENVTLSSVVTVVAPGSGSPTGTVSFYEFTGVQSCTSLGGAIAIGSGTISGGTASAIVNSLSVGTHVLTACYGGDSNFLASGSSTLSQVVDPATTTTALGVAPASQQYSDTTVFTATITPYSILTQELTGNVYFYVDASAVTCGTSAPAGYVGTDAIADADNGVGTFRYRVTKPAGTYTVTACFYSTNSSFTSSSDTETLTVTAEDAVVADADYSPDPVGINTQIIVTLKVREKYPETNSNLALAGLGGIDSAVVTADGTGILSSSNKLTFTCAKSGGVVGSGYTRYQAWSCTSTAGGPADTYDVVFTINGGYYTGSDDLAVQVTDPSLGFTTGGGWFYEGTDHVNFGFQAKATTNKNKVNYQGAVLIIRHLPDGSVIRAKSNVFDGYSISLNTASFSGKATYSVNGNSLGNFAFTGYAEDNGTPGAGADKFGLYLAYSGNQIATSTTLAGLKASATVISGGNIQVPQPSR